MSAEALVMRILSSGEMSGSEIAAHFPWFWFWEPQGALERLERIGMITARPSPFGLAVLYRIDDHNPLAATAYLTARGRV